MTVSRPRLVLVPGEAPLDPHLMESLRSIFEIVEAKDQAAAQQLVRDEAGAMLLCSADALSALVERSAEDASTAAVHEIGDGMGIVDADGNLKWTNVKLRQFSQQVRRQFVDMCRESVSLFNEAGADASTGDQHQNHRFSFEADSRHYELVTSRASSGTSDPDQVDAVIGVLWDVTRTRHLLDKLDAIDAAGSALMKLEASEITKLNAAERLDMLEQKIARYIHDLLGFDNFELRLVDRETGRLELVMAVGITADRIGEVINPELQGSGITGHVAATGQSYLCPNVKEDPLYREGLDNAASSLTVPLRLHDEVIGVFNIESSKELVMAIGLPPEPIDFDALDEQPVELIVLLASPPTRTADHIQALGKISRIMSDPSFRSAAYSATSAETLYQLFREAEKPVTS